MKKEEFVKLGISEELAQKAAEASAEELKVFIPKERYDEVSEKNKALTEDIKTRDSQIAELSKVDAAKLQERIDALQAENKAKDEERTKQEEAYKAQLEQTRIDNAIELALKDANARNIEAAKALIKRDGIKIDNDSVAGVDEQVKALIEGEGTSFMFEAAPPINGLKPGQAADNANGAQGEITLGGAIDELF